MKSAHPLAILYAAAQGSIITWLQNHDMHIVAAGAVVSTLVSFAVTRVLQSAYKAAFGKQFSFSYLHITGHAKSTLLGIGLLGCFLYLVKAHAMPFSDVSPLLFAAISLLLYGRPNQPPPGPEQPPLAGVAGHY